MIVESYIWPTIQDYFNQPSFPRLRLTNRCYPLYEKYLRAERKITQLN
jgi:hypothetical protein